MFNWKEKAEAKRWGYTWAARFVMPNGVTFPKFFMNKEDMQEFMTGATENNLTWRDVTEL